MHFSLPVLAVICTLITITLSHVISGTNQLLDRGAELESRASSGVEERNWTGLCKPDNVYVRKEW